MTGFHVKKRNNDQYQFNLHARNGEIILTSQEYDTKDGCLKGIASVQRHASGEDHFERLVATNGNLYFNLKAGNNEVIGTSEMYTTAAARDKGIAFVMAYAPGAKITDES